MNYAGSLSNDRFNDDLTIMTFKFK
jgi:hypothetical protein